MAQGVKKSRKSLTQRSMEEARKRGLRVANVEKWINVPGHPGGGVRRDMFGLFDLVVIEPGVITGIQSTGYTHRSEHISKMMENENLSPWIEAGGKVEIWTWKKKVVQGKPKYEVRKEVIGFHKSSIEETYTEGTPPF